MWRRPTVIVSLLLAAGCASFGDLSPETRAEEIAWQSLHAVDALQTLSIARDPECFQETTDPLLPRHPSQGAVVLWAAAASVLHFAVTDYLAKHTSATVVRLWQGVTIGTTSYWVVHNYAIGIRILSHDEPRPGTCGEK